MEKIKQTGNFLTPTDKKCPQKHSTLLRLYIIYKAWSVSLKWREWKLIGLSKIVEGKKCP